jgi:catechol 2,3-dioxygenase-like lactoylglutathione lyase family enzyme
VRVDHLACPCFDIGATHRFWTEVMGAPLVHAQSGKRWLLLAFDFAGVLVDYFVIAGEERPPSRGRDEIRHYGLAVGSPAEVSAWKARIAASGAEMWTEDHGNDEHVYFFDPSGNLFEITADEWTVRSRGFDPDAAARTLAAWTVKTRSSPRS